MKKLIVLAAALCMVATSAYAADWNFYGSARVTTQNTKIDTGFDVGEVIVFSESNVGVWATTNASIGANVAISDELTGRFEYGSNGGANIRLLYGTWNFGAGSLIIGQDYDPLLNGLSNSVCSVTTSNPGGLDDLNGLLWGQTYGGRNAQIKLKFGDFQVAVVAPNVSIDGLSEAPIKAKVSLPKIVASYRMAQDNWWVKLAGGYQTCDLYESYDEMYSYGVQPALVESVGSYVVNLAGGVTFGAMKFGGTVYSGQNPGNIILIAVDSAAIAQGGRAKWDGQIGQVSNNNSFGYQLVASYQVNDMFTLETGVAYANTELKEEYSTKDEVVFAYLQSAITLAPGVMVVPEIGRVDYKEVGQQKVDYLSVKWQIYF